MPTLTIHPLMARIECHEAETLLDSLRRHGYRVPHACRNGVCHICTADWVAGEMPDKARYPSSLSRTNSQADQALVLLCQCIPKDDCEITMPDLKPAHFIEPVELTCRIESITAWSGSVFGVTLEAPAGKLPEFHAGQYVQLLIDGQEGAFFSLASAPGKRSFELHIQVVPGHESAEKILEALQANSTVRVRLPMGKAFLAEAPRGPVILAAAGTGFAQMKSLYEWLRASGYLGDIHLFWGVRKTAEFYALPTLSGWEDDPNLYCHTVSGDLSDNEWQGHHHELLRVIGMANLDWPTAQAFISGSPAMVYALSDELEKKGLGAAQIHSDVFEYAPR